MQSMNGLIFSISLVSIRVKLREIQRTKLGNMLACNLKSVRGMQKNENLWFSGETKV